LNNPEAIAIDRAGNLYISELLGQHIRKVTPGGVISTVIGQAGTGFGGDNGAASQAKYSGNSPALATDASGNLYIADGARVRRISTDGVITTFAGTGSADSAAIVDVRT
jgi:serine/threonine-protein kinase